ncbi:MAG: hypothetical protein KDE27_12390 [Planctomycetes bacterium]|nr:hypothetical protein [Planctomycetota bacterium]
MRIRLFLPALLAVGVAIYFWQTAPNQNVPACTWRIGSGTEFRQAKANFEELPPGTPLRLSLVLSEPRHVYVFAHSDEDGTILMFPSVDLKSNCSNPLPVGRTVLPGELEGTGESGTKELAWTTRPGLLAVATYIVVASDHPVAELDELLPKVRRWTNTVFPDGSMAVTKPTAGEQVSAGPHQPIPPGLLRDAAAIGSVDTGPYGPMKPAHGYEGVFTASWKVREEKGHEAASPIPGLPNPALPNLPKAPPPVVQPTKK